MSEFEIRKETMLGYPRFVVYQNDERRYSCGSRREANFFIKEAAKEISRGEIKKAGGILGSTPAAPAQ